LIEEFDWATTPLGARESWPSSLETALGLCLVSPLPTMIWWGPDLIQLYNQPFARFLGERHPAALGQRARECWADIWDVLEPPVQEALRGRSSSIELDPEEAPSQRQTSMLFAPIQDGSGQPAGVWHYLLERERRSQAGAASRLRARESFLSAAGELLSSSLDSERSLATLARLVTSSLAQYCAVDLTETDGSLRRVALSHADPVKLALAWDCWRKFREGPESTGYVSQAIQSQSPVHIPELDDVTRQGQAREPEHLTLLQELRLSSVVIVPLTARQRVLGAMTLGTCEPMAQLTQEDVVLAERLAWKAGVAIDNSRLFRQARDAASQSEESLSLLDTVFRTAPVGLAFLDRELRYVRVNDALAAIDGRSVEEHLGATLGSVWPESVSTLEPLFRRVFETGEPIREVELKLAAGDGPERQRYLQASYYPVHGADGDVAWVGTVIWDITQRHLIEDALRESNEQYGALARAIPAILFSTRADGSCDYVSEQFAAYTGQPVAAPGGFLGLDAVHPEDAERTQGHWLESMRMGVAFEIEFRLRRLDGAYRWFRCCCSPVRDSEGRVAKWFGLFLDIQDEREAGETMRQAQKLESIGLLAGGIAHDFNNLLTGVLGNASLALRVLPKPSPARELVHDVVNASKRAAALTGQLLAYAGKGRFNIAPVNLSSLALDISGLLRASIPRKVAIQFELDPDLPSIQADASQLQQVLMNLVLNGAEAIGDNSGTVWVRARVREVTAEEIARQHSRFALTPGPHVEVEVTDTGSGIEPVNLNRIFDPFFTTKFMGRGLGLAATLGIVRGHEGSITVRSQVGKGSSFLILLPALAEAGASSTAPPTPTQQGGGELILIVDDEEVVRRAARAALQTAGYRTLEAEDGLAALDLFRRHGDEIALVLLDMTMPILSGDEAVPHLMKIRPDAVVVASSGYGELEAQRRFEGTGVRGLLQKPYTSEQLIAMVSRLARRPS
jgi:two-component system, cell cycle sensor histidine kinase and response regulator CckA